MDIQKLLEENHFNLSSSELQIYKDIYDICMPCIERDITMIMYCGDRIRDNYSIAVYASNSMEAAVSQNGSFD